MQAIETEYRGPTDTPETDRDWHEIGDTVRMTPVSVDDIPAFRAMRGMVFWVSEDRSQCRVQWSKYDRDEFPRPMWTVTRKGVTP